MQWCEPHASVCSMQWCERPRASAPCNGASLTRASAPCNGASEKRASAPCNGASSRERLLHAMCERKASVCSMQWCEPHASVCSMQCASLRERQLHAMVRAKSERLLHAMVRAPRASAPCNGASEKRASAPCNGASLRERQLHAMCEPHASVCSMQCASEKRASAPCNGASLTRASAPCNGASEKRASAPCNVRASRERLLHAMVRAKSERLLHAMVCPTAGGYSEDMRATRPDSATGSERGELAIIRQIRARAARSAANSIPLGIGDDCALIRPAHEEIASPRTSPSPAVTSARLHPPSHRPPSSPVSATLAAMGARPVAPFFLGLPRELATLSGHSRLGKEGTSAQHLDGRISRRILRPRRRPQKPVGRATSPNRPSPCRHCPHRAVLRAKALLRSGARPATFSMSPALRWRSRRPRRLAELARRPPQQLKCAANPKEPCRAVARISIPSRASPRPLPAARSLASRRTHISDASPPTSHLCDESSVAAEVDAALLPMSPGATLAQALHGGEDYELIFTAPANARIPKSIAGFQSRRLPHRLAPVKPPPVTLPHDTRPPAPRTAGLEHFS